MQKWFQNLYIAPQTQNFVKPHMYGMSVPALHYKKLIFLPTATCKITNLSQIGRVFL